MRKYDLYERACLWNAFYESDRFTAAILYCEHDEEAFDILTELEEVYGDCTYDEISRWIKTMYIKPSMLVCMYKIAEKNIGQFYLYLEDMYNNYCQCYSY